MRNENKTVIKNIIEQALKEFSEVQTNLSSDSAREVIALRISTDITSRFVLVPDEWPNDANDGQGVRKLY